MLEMNLLVKVILQNRDNKQFLAKTIMNGYCRQQDGKAVKRSTQSRDQTKTKV